MRKLGLALIALAMGLLALGAGIAGCGNAPDQQIRIGEDVIATYYDKTSDFGSFKTFSIAPEIRRIGNLTDGGPQLAGTNTDAVLAYVAGKLTERGYREVAAGANPDLGVLVSLLLIPTTITYDPYYWYGYYYPPYYWGYPPYYGYYPAYGYTQIAWVSGTVAIDVVDLRSARASGLLDAGFDGGANVGRLPIIWTAYVYGVLDYSSNLGRLFDGFDQAFVQSPYLTARAQ